MSDPVLIGTVTDGNGLKIEVWATETANGVEVNVRVVEGSADLRGFFFDTGGKDVDVAKGDAVTGFQEGDLSGMSGKGFNDVNMNGTGETYDAAVAFGTAGMGKDDYNDVTFTITGLTLADLDGLDFGIRATSTGDDREGSVKLTGTLDVPEEPPKEDHFPDNGHALSYATFYFGTTDGDTQGMPNGDPVPGKDGNPPDGVYTVKINFPDGEGNDLDDYYADILAYIIENDPNVDADTPVLGVAIHAGEGDPKLYETFYEIDNDPNDEDTVPSPPGDQAIGNEVDTVIQFDDVFPTV